MPQPSAVNTWSPLAKDDVSIANARVLLAIVRVYRRQPPLALEVDAELVRPLWPVLRLDAVLLREALLSVSASRRRSSRRKTRIATDGEPANWPTELMDAARFLPMAPPDTEVLETLAEGLLAGGAAFQRFYDAVEARLTRFVAKRVLKTDRNVTLVSDILGLNSAESGLLLLAHAVEKSTIGGSPFRLIARPARRVDAVRDALDQADDRMARDALQRQGRLMRSGLIEHADRINDMEDLLVLSRQGTALLNATSETPDGIAACILKPVEIEGASENDAVQPAWPHIEPRTRMLESALVNALASGERGINLLIHGGPGTGKTRYAARLIERTRAMGWSVIDADEGGASASRAERLASLQLSQAFAPSGSVLVLDEAEDIFSSDYNSPLMRIFGGSAESKSWMNNLLESNRCPVIWISNQIGHMDPAYLRRFTYCLEMPAAPRSLRRAIAGEYLRPLSCSEALMDSVSAHPQVTPALLASAARFARIASAGDDAVRCMIDDSLKALGADPSGAPRTETTRYDTRYLRVEGALPPERVVEGLQRLSRGAVLLSGAPGTGKTQFAAEVALRMGRELVTRTAADINTKWYGESERNVARMFRDCDPEREVLFLDEADTLLSARGTGHRADTAVTAEFLRRVEAFEGVFICATNHGSWLDPAMMRRFTFRLVFKPLDAMQRRQMLHEVAFGWRPDAGVPLPELPSSVTTRLDRLDQLTPGDFANALKRVRALGLNLDADGWVNELSVEHNTKRSSESSPMGFF